MQGWSQQEDYRGNVQISGQVWKMEFMVCSDNQETFSIRLPYPNYTYNGEWADYSTKAINIVAEGECGPILHQLHHYNQGYSNEGVWMEFIYPCYDNMVRISIQQNVNVSLPGLQYPLTFFTNNRWMDGTDIIDVHSPIVSAVLSEALGLAGDWHTGNRSVPEKIVNWMNMNMTWNPTPTGYPKNASTVLLERTGDCDEWAHAACALLIKAGMAAKVVLCGSISEYNSTSYYFVNTALHLGVAYWDGWGWILIDPQMSSGFGIPNRVILGSDQDIRDLEIKFDPDYLKYYVSDKVFSHEAGSVSGGLSWYGNRNNACNGIILEHDEATLIPSQGSEPVDNIIPNIVTDAYHAEIFPGTPRIANYPNPFNPVTTFNLELSAPGTVNVDLYSADGRFVANVFNGYVEKGQRQIIWKSAGIRSGVYFARLRSPEGSSSCKVIILR
jgi:hypothetical protein